VLQTLYLDTECDPCHAMREIHAAAWRPDPAGRGWWRRRRWRRRTILTVIGSSTTCVLLRELLS
jgi:hypothetical protein